MKNRWFAIAGIVGVAVAVMIIVVQAANLERPADITEQKQAPISIVDTVTITIPEGAANKVADGSSDEHYVPQLTTVSSDSQVTWVNADTVGHTATAGRPSEGPSGEFDTGTIPPGESKSVIVRAEGGQSLFYYCTIHPWLTGELQMTL
ncbi:MAG: hypothetical protein M3115_03030 [Thermoproteota archaeon]|nr:hypothetical protein [Thermoproteota archaeon]